MTKIDIISGFLGAGKTTLIKKLLADALKEQQVVLIENEFGEIGIDGGFLKGSGIEIREMNSGCICCSLAGDFEAALTEVVERYQPDRIIIEPSGVGKLSDVIHAVEGVKTSTGVVLNLAATVVDVIKCKMYLKNFGEFFKNQVQAAGTVILSRTDMEKATEDKINLALKLLRELNPDATIITTPVAELDGRKVLDTMEGVKLDLSHVEEEQEHRHHGHAHGEHCHEHGHEHGGECRGEPHHHASEVFKSWGRETVKKFEKEQIEKIVTALSGNDSFGMVLRAKGMVEGRDGRWIYFDMVPGEADIREGAPEYTGRICVIGAGLAEDKLEELFQI